jgi:hypothetical protein
MKKFPKAAAVVALLAVVPSAAYAFPGGFPGNEPYPGLCTMGNPDGSGAYFTRIPCWANAIVNHPSYPTF